MRTRWPLILALLPVPMMAQPACADARAAFVGRHRCAIVARLAEIHRRGPRDTSRDRFITVALVGEPQSYVQCIFFDSDRKMFCEASSGAYRFRPQDGLRLKQEEDSVSAIKALGFVQEKPDENFQREVDLANPPDFRAVADLMLVTLREGYRAGPDAILKIKAPKAGAVSRSCDTPRR